MSYHLNFVFVGITLVIFPNSLSSVEFPGEGVQFLDEKGHKVQGAKTNSAFQGIMRNKDTISAITLPQLSDGLYSLVDVMNFH